MEIKNKIAIVTGASSGIGLSTAKLLAREGAKVALVARSEDKLIKLAKELKDAFVVVADMSKEQEVRQMIKKVKDHYGRIDILVNNAGRGYDASIEQTEIKLFRELTDLDLIGPLVAIQSVIPIMRKQGGGAIVNISSGTALMALPNMAGYSALKRAVVGISLTAREELKKDKITVSVVFPTMTDTNFEKNTLKSGEIVWESGGDWKMPDVDPPEFIAKKIVEAIRSGVSEVYAHDWMKR
jgi:short-subunit dehydrogenase